MTIDVVGGVKREKRAGVPAVYADMSGKSSRCQEAGEAGASAGSGRDPTGDLQRKVVMAAASVRMDMLLFLGLTWTSVRGFGATWEGSLRDTQRH
jgi:hypothetical protein